MYDSRDTYSIPQEELEARRVLRRWHFRDKIPARLVLYFLSWSGFLVSFMMRNDMNFALVAIYPNDNLNKNMTNTSHTLPGGGTEEQTSIVKSVIISSFYWCYVLSQVAGGVATQFFGTNIITDHSRVINILYRICR
ncbi:uncharacterized protein LOC117584608 isoform X4 [Drosophila guanche]|uniref:uncharacterized protein LOC117584608 isoform X4 n=1 Tax=Drosophila guanche TaxID=7266 RepID=UPI00147249DF|nr:uncharacterized protein LOC117584608 isoform X4 [Drosophila guanche]